MQPDGSLAILEGQGYKENPAGPAIYVYELPPHVSTWWVVGTVLRGAPTPAWFCSPWPLFAELGLQAGPCCITHVPSRRCC